MTRQYEWHDNKNDTTKNDLQKILPFPEFSLAGGQEVMEDSSEN